MPPSLCSELVAPKCKQCNSFLKFFIAYMVRYITGPPSFQQHNQVNMWFIYMEIPGSVAEGMIVCKSENNLSFD